MRGPARATLLLVLAALAAGLVAVADAQFGFGCTRLEADLVEADVKQRRGGASLTGAWVCYGRPRSCRQADSPIACRLLPIACRSCADVGVLARVERAVLSTCSPANASSEVSLPQSACTNTFPVRR